VHVSQPQNKLMMREILVSADPADTNHLLGCGVVDDERKNEERTVVYVSVDAGKTWKQTLETENFSGDPACTLGRDGLAIHVTMAVPQKKSGLLDWEHLNLDVYRSTDGGNTWAKQEGLPMHFQGIDNEAIIVDNTQSKYKGNIYVSGTSHVRDLAGGSTNAFAVWTSRDGGKTFSGLVKRADAAGHYVLDVGNSAVLSDGTLVSVLGDTKMAYGGDVPESKSGKSNAELLAVKTTDGGTTLSEGMKVDDFYMINLWASDGPPPSHSRPVLATDPGDGPFKDRLYEAWSDNRGGRGAIRFAYSADQGKTWRRSQIIDDIPGPIDRKSGPENFQPAIAVNKSGVVMVTWYDRRDNPDGLGWYLRARASLDGGETWLPSVRVSAEPNVFSPRTELGLFASATKPSMFGTADSDSKENVESKEPINPVQVSGSLSSRQFFAGDYAGLAADASGIFHAFWIDDRSGLPQIWTAPITVDGTVVKNGDPSLANLKDVSADLDMKVVSDNYDRSANTVTFGIEFINTSKKVIRGPLKLRLVGMSSTVGSPSAANADNGIAQLGAVWDCTSLLTDGALKADNISGVKQLIFRMNSPLSILDGKVLRAGSVINFEVRVLAGSSEPEKP
jgi:hypothetical protein